jgi:hypothetical protein
VDVTDDVAVEDSVDVLVKVGDGLDGLVVLVGKVVCVGIFVGLNSLGLVGVGWGPDEVGMLVSWGLGKPNFTPPSENANKNPPTTMRHKKSAKAMPMNTPKTFLLWLFSLIRFVLRVLPLIWF